MQVAIYTSGESRSPVKLVDKPATRRRTSHSAVASFTLEDHFERHNRCCEIPVDLGMPAATEPANALDPQEDQFSDKALGELLLSSRGIEVDAVDRALSTQRRLRKEFALV